MATTLGFVARQQYVILMALLFCESSLLCNTFILNFSREILLFVTCIQRGEESGIVGGIYLQLIESQIRS